jgi:hypothetical protein
MYSTICRHTSNHVSLSWTKVIASDATFRSVTKIQRSVISAGTSFACPTISALNRHFYRFAPSERVCPSPRTALIAHLANVNEPRFAEIHRKFSTSKYAVNYNRIDGVPFARVESTETEMRMPESKLTDMSKPDILQQRAALLIYP